jgi:nucleoside-diphosphate-sugar epimerase
MRILMTGGTGFVGSGLGPRLLSEGHEVFAVSRPGNDVKFGCTIPWDFESGRAPAGLPDKIDAVIHLAQARNYQKFPTDAQEMFNVNVAMTAAVLNLAAVHGARQFCLVSSGAVYEPFHGQIVENARLAPTSYLGASKLAAEVISHPYTSIFNVCILRLFFPFGPGQRDRLIPGLIGRIRRNEKIQVSEDGEGATLVPTFVDDIVRVCSKSISSKWAGVFNVAAGRAMSISSIAKIIGRELSIEPCFERVDQPAVRIVPDITLMRQYIDMEGFVSFEDGLRRTLAVADL